MAKKQFKTESKRILDLMINSIYTNKEIFIRELISNASDALDKLAFKALTDDSIKMKKSDYAIELNLDSAARTITIADNGIGMSREELENNLGTIARSGSLEFVRENAEAKDIDIIGQFGVGFYSAFMVASKVEVLSRAFNSEEAFKWVSEGADGYTINPSQKDKPGTTITLTLKPDGEGENYSQYLDQYRMSELVKKYSDYVRFPIKMEMKKSRKKEGSDEYESYTEIETLNSMVPIWKRSKRSVKEEDYKSFYKERFYDYNEPLKVIHQHAEGTTEYYALLFVPSKADYNFYSKDFERGLSLYSSGVLIMDKCAELLPEYFGFIKGLVDSEDLTLNISRETLQHDRQLTVIRTALEKRIKKELEDMLKNERESYEKLWESFGLSLKFGIYRSFGAAREALEELLMFRRASDGKWTTLREYRDGMKGDQKYIYFASGESVDKISKLPAAELVRDKGYELLCFTDEVDEFLTGILLSYDEKEYKSLTGGGDLGLESEQEKSEKEAKEEENKELLDCLRESLGGEVASVKLSQRLKSHPVCLTSEGAITLEMEKTFASMPGAAQAPKATRVLEISDRHPVFEKLRALWEEGDKDLLAKYARLLYDQALLIEGFSIEDPVAFSNQICELML
ncbi:MAG: molecular chaperone HtpG [Oscillospiraceae bacterium]|nr:molecular chaperone HtpG [Oscillospiraceae bacterium]